MNIKTQPAPDSVWNVEIISVRPMNVDAPGTALRAFVDIRLAGCLVITQCAILDGKRGLFATLPRQIARDGRWRDVVIVADDSLRAHIQSAILAQYEEDMKNGARPE